MPSGSIYLLHVRERQGSNRGLFNCGLNGIKKATSNLGKHQVSFEEAHTVFYDPLAYIFDDEWHSTDEQREIIIGHSNSDRLLLVSFTERSPGLIRIIGARHVTRRERKDYEESRND
jgi:uncharacterized DUF497 family protein